MVKLTYYTSPVVLSVIALAHWLVKPVKVFSKDCSQLYGFLFKNNLSKGGKPVQICSQVDGGSPMKLYIPLPPNHTLMFSWVTVVFSKLLFIYCQSNGRHQTGKLTSQTLFVHRHSGLMHLEVSFMGKCFIWRLPALLGFSAIKIQPNSCCCGILEYSCLQAQLGLGCVQENGSTQMQGVWHSADLTYDRKI